MNPRSSPNDHFDLWSRSGLPEPRPFADAGQLFQTDPAPGGCGFPGGPLRDPRIFVRLQSAFLAGARLQFSLAVLRARARAGSFPRLPTQRAADLILLLASLCSLRVGVDLAIIVGGEIHHPEIHPDELWRSHRGSFGQAHGHEQNPLAVLAADQLRCSWCQTEPFALSFAPHERNPEAPFPSQNRTPVPP